MIVEYVRYRLKSVDAGPAFEQAYESAAPSLEASPECVSYELTRCHEEPERYVLRIVWRSLEGHLAGFRKSEEFKPFLAAVRPYIEDLEEMQHYAYTRVRSH